LPLNTSIMKQSILFLAILALLTSQAQVINSDFEIIKPNGKISNWGINFFQPVSIDVGSGQSVADQILFDNYIDFSVSSTNEAFSGNKALDIRNAYNNTKQQVIPGGAMVFHDATQDMPGWGAGMPVALGDEITLLGFYHKFMPFGTTDIVTAELVVFGESGEIGRATITISDPNFLPIPIDFSYVETPVIYSSTETPIFMTLSFMMGEIETATFGTRWIIDNVRVNNSLLATSKNTISKFSVLPTLADDQITILRGNVVTNLNSDFRIFNTQGSLIKKISSQEAITNVNISNLTAGMYYIISEGFLSKFIKK
jgi:Secretion system C-terminal sorting domain